MGISQHLQGVSDTADLGSRTQNLGFTKAKSNSRKPCSIEGYDLSPACLGAQLGVWAEKVAPAAPDLAAVLSAWETLPAPIKAGIVAMVKAVPK